MRLFFVLSGFLITGILLDSRGVRPKTAYITFMARRALRLLPIYTLLILALVAANVQDIRDVALWHLGHSSNLLFAIRDDHVPWVTAHHWSLSVEEQFYLLWPILILWLPQPWLKSVVLGTIAAGVLLRWAAWEARLPNLALYYLPFASLDALGAGALLALWSRSGKVPRSLWVWGPMSAAATVAMFTVPAVFTTLGEGGKYVLGEAVSVPAMVALVAVAAGSRQDAGLARFAVTSLAPLGRISYGIYLYHNAVLVIVFRVAERLDAPSLLGRSPALFAVASLLTVATAAASWFVLERPLLRLKEKLPYARTRSETEGDAATQNPSFPVVVISAKLGSPAP